MKRIQDSVHGLMEFRGMERVAVDVLRARELQRLRRIRQLGLVHLVFPAAEHSRFTHSIGAAHVMTRFASALVTATTSYLPSSLQPDERMVRDLVLAALCHDLGHGPLSHTWERSVVRNYDEADWTRSLGLGEDALERYPWLKRDERWPWHELVTQALLLASGSELHDMLEDIESGISQRIAALLGGRFFLPYLADFFASDVDVDRCDFVLRDAYQSGVAHGRYDLNWLVSTVGVGESPARPVFGFDAQKAPRVIEQLLIARRALYDTVYQHRAVRSAEGMVGLLLKQTHRLATSRAGKSPFDGFGVLWRAIAGRPLTHEEVLELDDDSLWEFIRHIAREPLDDPPACQLARMLLGRQLFKPLPLSEAEVASFALAPLSTDDSAIEESEAQNEIDRELRRLGYEPPESFRFLDRAVFTFFHSDDLAKGSWLVDSGPGRRATPLRTHETFVHHEKERSIQRLYVPPDAVGPIMDAWRRQHSSSRSS